MNTINKDILIQFQINEITEYYIYQKLAAIEKDPHNKETLLQIGRDEKAHYLFWKNITGVEPQPRKWYIFRFVLLARLLGLTFAIKLLEKKEEKAQIRYADILDLVPNADKIIHDENDHEHKLIAMLKEERLNYVGSIVLGLNDALVELTAALAGFTLAIQDTRVIAVVGLITGIAASFSMAASEYLSQKAEEGSDKHPIKSSLYTGTAYIITVFLLIMPYLIFSNYLVCLGVTLTIAISIIFFFNYYISVAKDLPFKKRFFEMALISIGVSALTFCIGFVVRHFFGFEI